MDFIKEKINTILGKLKEFSQTKLSDVLFQYIKCDGYKKDNRFPPDDADWKDFEVGQRLSGIDEHYWIRFSVNRIGFRDKKAPILSFKTGREGQWDARNPQGLVFLNGKTVQALDTNHTWVDLEFEKDYEVYIYLYTGMEPGDFDVIPEIYLRDIPTYDLYWDVCVARDAMPVLAPNSYEYTKIKDALDKTLMKLDFREIGSDAYYGSIQCAGAFIREELYRKLAGGNGTTVSCIGHTHIDVAWLWTVAQTREKAERSFSTVLHLMEKYPDYKFMSSQPQLYQYVKEANPEVYSRIKEMVREGRWEVEGAMWLEPDCNLTSGESMVRQILYGKRFMKGEFGVDSNILWLPDVFGYSAALPQIMKKTGVDRFFTTKLQWNEFNKLPHDTFLWQGIDGSEVFASFTTSYSMKLEPKMVLDTWETYKDKSLTDETLMLFGFADGGGGPTAEMLERYERLKNGLPGIPRANIKKAGEFFDSVEKNFRKNTAELKRLPKWIGELYLEMHRGTYTSMAKNKKYNRRCEFLYQKAEAISLMDMVLCGGQYEGDTLHKNWTNILLNQFHDIIPGSSIKEVYDVTDREYEHILAEGNRIADTGKNHLIANIKTDGGLFVYNPTSFEISDYITWENGVYYADKIPPHGYRVIEPKQVERGVTVGEYSLENDVICVTFDPNYQIISIFDKEADREVIEYGKVANRLEIYEDYPKSYDAWEISEYYNQKMWVCDDVSTVQFLENGIQVVRKYGRSEIVQTIVLRKGSKRIDFITKVDWHEDHALLKAAFPLDIHTNKATYDIQFGNVERPNSKNTSWEAAKFEVCAHKWGDLSEADYGVSILNDCKYGYSADENTLSVSLLKSATYPNPEADRGSHEFTYSLFPHQGDWRFGKVTKEAFRLNTPLEVSKIGKTEGILPEAYSFVRCDHENLVIDTVKKAEDDNSVIVRLFENYNMKTTAAIQMGFQVKKAVLCDMLENEQEELPVQKNEIRVHVSNYEIITLKVYW